jgi:hypothetical protein
MLAAVNIVYRYVGTVIPRWLSYVRSEKQREMAGKHYNCVIIFSLNIFPFTHRSLLPDVSDYITACSSKIVEK